MLKFKKDFPIFSQHRKLVYLDSAATSQKPKAVIAAITDWYQNSNANVHRGAYRLAEEATALYEQGRARVANFIKAPEPESIIFTKGTTEAINLVAQSWAKYNLKKGEVILLTEMEHHSNIVPWQLLAQEKGLKLRYWPIDRQGQLTRPDKNLFGGVKLLALTQISNVLGTINPVAQIIQQAHRRGIKVLVDAAQSAPHLPINVKQIDPDFLAFSSHKMLGPTGLGVLYVKKERLTEMRPYQGGGEMIKEVSRDTATYKAAPWKFEAGTQPLAQVIGLVAAINYLQKIGLKKIWQHDQELTRYAYKKLSQVPGLAHYGPKANQRSSLISFNLSDIHPHDLATWLDQSNLAVRAGHHCTQLLHKKLGLEASVRASFYLYNSKKDVDALVGALKLIQRQWQNSTKK